MPSKRFDEFCNLASAHGFPLMSGSKSCGAMVFWIVWYVLMTLMCIMAIMGRVRHYTSAPINTKTEQIHEEKSKFPAVTVCNLNAFKLSSVKNNIKLNQILKNLTAESESGFGTKKAAMTKAKDELVLTTLSLDKSEIEKLIYDKNEFIIDCVFGGNDCAADISTAFSPEFGVCFTFKDENTELTKSGPMHGLEFEFDIKLSEYLPTAPIPGIMLMIHEPHIQPSPEAHGQMIPAGGMTTVGIEKWNNIFIEIQTERVRNCNGGNWMEENEDLSQATCLQTCNQKRILDKCKCASPKFPLPEGANYCEIDNQKQANCLEEENHKPADCDCSKPCQENTYSVVTSTVPMRQNGECPNDSTESECNDAMQSKTSVQIYMRTLDTTRYAEMYAYTMADLIGEIGFCLMLYLGINLVNMWEMIVFACQSCCCKGD